MKVIVTTTAADLDSPVDPRFGRAAYFTVVDTDTMEWQAHPNPAVTAPGGPESKRRSLYRGRRRMR